MTVVTPHSHQRETMPIVATDNKKSLKALVSPRSGNYQRTNADIRVPKNALLRRLTATHAEADLERKVLIPQSLVELISGQQSHVCKERSEEDDGLFVYNRRLRHRIGRCITVGWKVAWSQRAIVVVLC